MQDIILWGSSAFVALILALVGREDLRYLGRARLQAEGEVTGYRSLRDENGLCYAAILRFTERSGATHEVIDMVYCRHPQPPIGTRLPVVWPEGCPGKARVRRPWLRAMLYALLGGMLALLLARATGRIGG